MTRKGILRVLVFLVLLGVFYYFYGGHSTPIGQSALINLSPGDLAPLKTAFNVLPSSIRVSLMLSPT